MQPKLAEYRNDREQAIVVRIGERPGEPPVEYPCEPGKTVLAPANYRERMHREGLVFVREMPRKSEPTPETGDAFGLLRAARETVETMRQEVELLRRKNDNLASENTELKSRLAAYDATASAAAEKPAEKKSDEKAGGGKR